MYPPLNLKFDSAKQYLEPCDLLLFKGKGIVSRFIKVFSKGKYTHIGLVSRSNGYISLLEMREWKGGREVNLEREIKKYPGQIDVYRAAPTIKKCLYDRYLSRIVEKEIVLDKIAIVDCMKELTGSDYNYGSIWQIAKRNLPGIRWFYSNGNMEVDNPVVGSISYICSSAIANCFSKSGYKLVLNKRDELITPNDISRSSSISYLFTLV